MSTDSKMVLNHLPGNAGDVGCLPYKHMTFAHRKVMSTPSYLLSRVELMVKAPPVPSSLTDTFLVSGGVALDFLLLPAELSGSSSMGAQHPEEVRLPEWVQGVSPVFSSPGLRWQEQVPWRQLLRLLPGRVGRRKSTRLSCRRGR